MSDWELNFAKIPWAEFPEITWPDITDKDIADLKSWMFLRFPVHVVLQRADLSAIGYRFPYRVCRTKLAVDGVTALPDEEATFEIFARTGFGNGAEQEMANVSLVYNGGYKTKDKPGTLWIEPADFVNLKNNRVSDMTIGPFPLIKTLRHTVRENIRIRLTL